MAEILSEPKSVDGWWTDGRRRPDQQDHAKAEIPGGINVRVDSVPGAIFRDSGLLIPEGAAVGTGVFVLTDFFGFTGVVTITATVGQVTKTATLRVLG